MRTAQMEKLFGELKPMVANRVFCLLETKCVTPAASRRINTLLTFLALHLYKI